jgi:Zn-dependent metalloprotease
MQLSSVIPPYILQALAERGSPAQQRAAAATLVHDRRFRAARPVTPPPAVDAVAGDPQRTIRDAGGEEDLEGRVVRREGEPATGDAATDEAYDGLGATYALYWDVFRRDSIDGAGLPLDGVVHYGTNYDNAFWDGERMVFGDGDDDLFLDFTLPVDVIGHELTHGVTQYTANLEYFSQSGALNESMSDVFGSLIKQYSLGQSADQADWLIGAGLLGPNVTGVALRSMKEPGTAYDDDVLGKDPQPATMEDYVKTGRDNGGVHINSGIPNHAFYLVATALGGSAWERAGQIWYDVLTGGELATTAQFTDFAALTVAAARSRYGEGAEQEALLKAWSQVGVPTN